MDCSWVEVELWSYYLTMTCPITSYRWRRIYITQGNEPDWEDKVKDGCVGLIGITSTDKVWWKQVIDILGVIVVDTDESTDAEGNVSVWASSVEVDAMEDEANGGGKAIIVLGELFIISVCLPSSYLVFLMFFSIMCI